MIIGMILLALALGTQSETVAIQANSLMKKDVADGFPLLVFEVDFAVLEVHIKNESSQSFSVHPEELKVFSRKGKEIERALPTDIAPKLLKFYAGSSARVHGEASSGYPRRPSQADLNRAPTVGTPSTVGKIPATKGQEIRAHLESFELQPVTLDPGDEVGGYIYLKSKQSGNKLTGGYVQLNKLRAGF